MQFSAMVAAISGLIMLVLGQYALGLNVDMATAPALAVVAVTGLVAYLFPRHKELFGTIGGAVVVIIEAILSARTGNAVDYGTVTAAVTLIVQSVLLFALPRLQVITGREAGPDAGPTGAILRRDTR